MKAVSFRKQLIRESINTFIRNYRMYKKKNPTTMNVMEFFSFLSHGFSRRKYSVQMHYNGKQPVSMLGISKDNEL